MKRTLVLALLVLLLSSAGAAAVTHEVAVDGDDALVNTTLELTSEDRSAGWKIQWNIPGNADIIGVSDSDGDITDYDRSGSQLTIETNSDDPRRREVLEIRYRLPDQVTTWKDDLHILDLRFPGFSDETTAIQVYTPSDLIGTREQFGFESSFKDTTANFSGTGPANIRVTYTPKEGEYDHYILFGDANLSRADDAYPLLQKITGINPPFRKFAVVVLPDEIYDEQMMYWSAGTYRDGGIIFTKESEIGKDSFTGTMMHETMHGFNQKPMKWVGTNATLFDEGTAKYVEYVTNHKLDVRQAEIFGEPVQWEAPCSDQEGRCRYTLPPRGQPEHLWQYYQQGLDFMPRWTPSQEGSLGDNLTRRVFGYAFAELLIRQYVMQRSPEALQPVYSALSSVRSKAETSAEYRTTLENALGTVLQPCYSQQRSEVFGCLDDVNDLEPSVPETVRINGTDVSITFNPIEQPTVDEQSGSINGTGPGPIVIIDRQEKKGIARFFRQLFQQVANFFNALLQ